MMGKTKLPTLDAPYRELATKNNAAHTNGNGSDGAGGVPSIAHLAGAWKDDPFFDELMQSIADDRKAVDALFAEDADEETSATEEKAK